MQINWEATRNRNLVTRIIAEIVAGSIKVLRVHVSGDFDTVDYARKWLTIFRRKPKVQFFFYTRSWRKEDGSIWHEMVEVFREMAELPNVHPWFSEDRDTGPSPRILGVRVAFAIFRHQDVELVPAHADLVFRDRYEVNRTPPTKRINGVLVCPNEQGVKRQIAMTCTNCRICYTKGREGAAPC